MPPLITGWRYRGRAITPDDVGFIRRLLAAHPEASRRRLSAILCEQWQWKQPNGALRDMVCRGLLLMLHRAGEIELPPIRQISRNPFVQRERPPRMLVDMTPLTAALGDIRPLSLQQVRKTTDESLFNSLIEHHHYLAYQQPVGEHLKYLVWAQGRPIACLAWSSAPRHLGSRDRYIGWSQRRGDEIFALLLTTRAFSFCRGYGFHIWRRTSWASSRARCPGTGTGSTAIRFTSRKPSSIPAAFAAPVIARPTGF